MFGNFMNDDTKVSTENYYNIDHINKDHQRNQAKKYGSRNSLNYSHSKNSYSIELSEPRKKSCSKQHQYFTLDSSRSEYDQI